MGEDLAWSVRPSLSLERQLCPRALVSLPAPHAGVVAQSGGGGVACDCDELGGWCEPLGRGGAHSVASDLLPLGNICEQEGLTHGLHFFAGR